MKEYPQNNSYLVTEDAKVYSKITHKFLSTYTKDDGYVLLNIAGQKKRLHRVVAETYIPNPLGLPEVNHLDGVKSNCHKDNLEWCTSKQNKAHAWEMGLYKDIAEDHCHAIHTNEKIHKVCQLLQDGYRNLDIANALQVHKDTVAQIRGGTAWLEVSRHYRIEVKRVQRKSVDTILRVCSLLEEGKSNAEVVNIMDIGMNPKEVGRIRDGVTHTTISRNFNIPKSKFSRLTETEVIAVCSNLEAGLKNKEIADTVGVSTSSVSKIKRRLVWEHITCNYDW